MAKLRNTWFLYWILNFCHQSNGKKCYLNGYIRYHKTMADRSICFPGTSITVHGIILSGLRSVSDLSTNGHDLSKTNNTINEKGRTKVQRHPWDSWANSERGWPAGILQGFRDRLAKSCSPNHHLDDLLRTN